MRKSYLLPMFAVPLAAFPNVAFAGSQGVQNCDSVTVRWTQQRVAPDGAYVTIDVDRDGTVDYTTSSWASAVIDTGVAPTAAARTFIITFYGADNSVVDRKGNGVMIPGAPTDCFAQPSTTTTTPDETTTTTTPSKSTTTTSTTTTTPDETTTTTTPDETTTTTTPDETTTTNHNPTTTTTATTTTKPTTKLPETGTNLGYFFAGLFMICAGFACRRVSTW